jgi:hypothetical protein
MMKMQYGKAFLVGMLTLLWIAKPSTRSPDTLWTETYGELDVNRGNSVQQTADGGYIIAGSKHLRDLGHENIYLLKTGPNGDTLWTKALGGDICAHGYSVQQTTDGGYIIAGSYDVVPDVYLVKTATDGSVIWAKTYGGTSSDCGYSVQQTLDGGSIGGGSTDSFGPGNEDVYLIKTDSDGDTLWTRTYGGNGWDYGYSVKQTSDGGYIIAGSYDSSDAVNYDVYLVRTDPDGDTLWTRTYGGDGWDDGYSVEQTSDGGYIITGCTGSVSEGYLVWLIKMKL